MYYLCIFLILILILAIVLIVILPNNEIINYNETDKNIKLLLRQTARWAVASEQDKSPMISVLHANYAIGYLQALQDIATEKEINQYVNFPKFKEILYKIQDNAVKKVVSSCPQYTGDLNKELTLIGIGAF